jgi:twitching motility two-component system response regulator PilG
MTKVIKVLTDITEQQRSGKLIVRDAVDSSITWEAYFGNGNLHFATSKLGQKERLIYLINRYCPDSIATDLTIDDSDYQFICDRWQSGQFLFQQARQLAFTSTQEAFIHIMAIDNANLHFDPDARLDTLILSTSVRDLIVPVEKLISHWQKIRPQINSPFARVALANVDGLYQLLWQQLQSTKAIESYQSALTQNLCLYSIATQLNIDILELSYLLRSLLQNRSVRIYGYEQQQTARPTIAYIDEDRSMQDSMKSILESQGYEAICLQPSQAIDRLIRTPPTLILIDVTMTDVNGYELCQLFRKSPSLKNIPIILLGDGDNLLDRLKAKIVGVNGYIKKPIAPKNFANLINEYLAQVLVST